MGIRVTKVLGYGLTDVKTRKYKIADGRINRKSPLLDWETRMTLDDYLDWLKAEYPTDDEKLEHLSMDMWLFKEREREDFDWYKETGVFDPQSLVHHGIEYMEKNVLLIRPLSCKNWERHDDPIDYVEETEKFRDDPYGAVNWYKEIPGGIFPYSGSFMNACTGERVKDGVELWRYLTWDSFKNLFTGDKLDAVCKTFGFDDAEDARQNLVPVVPNEIRDLVKWGKLFTNDDVWKQLRPLIYTYWS